MNQIPYRYILQSYRTWEICFDCPRMCGCCVRASGSSGVNVLCKGTETGKIANIYSYSTGFQFAWSWDQIGVKLINPDIELCIGGVMTYGLDLGGVLLRYKAAGALSVK